MIRLVYRWLFPKAGPLAWSLTGALALVAVQYLRYDAEVWDAARKVRDEWATGDRDRRVAAIREFREEAAGCDVCSGYWETVPVLLTSGPIVWLAANGAYLVLTNHAPTLEPPVDQGQEDDVFIPDELAGDAV